MAFQRVIENSTSYEFSRVNALGTKVDRGFKIWH